MKITYGLLVVLVLLMSGHSSGVGAQTISGPPHAVPDLIVKEIVFDSTPNKIRVRVMNEGTGAASQCYLALVSGLGNDSSLGTKRTWTIEIPELQAGKGFSNTIDVWPLTHSHGPWRAVVDRSNTVKESNESNNQLAYPPTGSDSSVKVRLADLQITRAVLIDTTTGEVSVEVSNKASGKAQPSILRLIVWEMGKFEQKEAKTVFVKVPMIGPFAKTNVKAKAGVPIISTKYSLFIDISNDVTETNENNNRFEGEAGKS
jgi:hypothetical protein